jgi:predicted nuclease of predicted toxin-antitoxin system
VKYLIDNQLPPKLAQWLTEQGHDGIHLQAVGLAGAQDMEVLEYAGLHGMVLISKDEDFFHLALSRPGPWRVIWVRLGNCRTRLLLSSFAKALPTLVTVLTTEQMVIELR